MHFHAKLAPHGCSARLQRGRQGAVGDQMPGEVGAERRPGGMGRLEAMPALQQPEAVRADQDSRLVCSAGPDACRDRLIAGRNLLPVGNRPIRSRHRARALVIAEDLGTAPEGFSDAIMHSGVLSYRILQFELARAGQEQLGPATASLTDLDDPRIDWVRLAHGFGVPARRVGSAEELTAALTWAQTESGPHLVQATL